MKPYDFTATAEFEIRGTIMADNRIDAAARLQDMHLAVFDSHCRTVKTITRAGGAGCSRARVNEMMVHYPSTVGIYKEENHAVTVTELCVEPITDVNVEKAS